MGQHERDRYRRALHFASRRYARRHAAVDWLVRNEAQRNHRTPGLHTRWHIAYLRHTDFAKLFPSFLPRDGKPDEWMEPISRRPVHRWLWYEYVLGLEWDAAGLVLRLRTKLGMHPDWPLPED